jgi:FkbM family methyltransferase
MKHPYAYLDHFHYVLETNGPYMLVTNIIQHLISKSMRIILGEAHGTRLFWILAAEGRVGRCGYEANASKLVFQIHGTLAVDIGASLGQYTIRLAKNFKRVLAIEPLPINIQILSTLTHELHLTNISIIPLAISDYDGIVHLHTNPENIHGGSSIINSQNKDLCVKSAKLDTLLSSERQIDFIKMDVEGAEWLVLNGSKQIMPRIKRWMIELHDAKRSRQMDHYLHDLGYRTQWIKDIGPNMYVLATQTSKD